MKKYFLLTIVFFLYPLAAEPYVIDRIEAVVNGKVITRGEVDMAVEAEELKLMSEGKEPPADLRGQALDSMINRALILEEARKFDIVEVGPDEVEKAFESVRKSFRSDEEFRAALRKEEMTEYDLRENLRDQLLAAKYVDRRVKYFIRVTLDEQKAYYRENKEKFGGREFADVQEEIYNILAEKETGSKLDEYLKDLRAKSKITVFK